ncbi:MAG: hypothetical protein NVS3B10_05220 [Polyangiales bacterium]
MPPVLCPACGQPLADAPRTCPHCAAAIAPVPPVGRIVAGASPHRASVPSTQAAARRWIVGGISFGGAGLLMLLKGFITIGFLVMLLGAAAYALGRRMTR